MSKKTMLVALAAACAVLLSLPGFASGQEIHVEGITAFTGTGGASALTAEGEPAITCETTDLTNGVVNSGGTTGSFSLDMTGCHGSAFGFTFKCRTSGSALDNTIQTNATFHLITFKEKPAILATPANMTLNCAGIAQATVSGSVIATITSPACGAESTQMTFKFSSLGAAQEDRLYTGVEYDLKFQTSGGAQVTAPTTQTWTISSTTKGKLNCT